LRRSAFEQFKNDIGVGRPLRFMGMVQHKFQYQIWDALHSREWVFKPWKRKQQYVSSVQEKSRTFPSSESLSSCRSCVSNLHVWTIILLRFAVVKYNKKQVSNA